MAKAKKIDVANLNFSWYDETLPEEIKKEATFTKEKENGKSLNLRDTVSAVAQEKQSGGVPLSGTKQSIGSGIGIESNGNGIPAGVVPARSTGDGQNDLPRSGNENSDSSISDGIEIGGDEYGDAGYGRGLSRGMDGTGRDARGSAEIDDEYQSGQSLLAGANASNSQEAQEDSDDPGAEIVAESFTKVFSRTKKTVKPGVNFSLSDSFTYPSDMQSRIKANLDAIYLLADLEVAGRLATADEQQVLAKFSGWGGMSKFFLPGNVYLTYENYLQLGKLVSYITQEKDKLSEVELTEYKKTTLANISKRLNYQDANQKNILEAMWQLSFAILAKKVRDGKLPESIQESLKNLIVTDDKEINDSVYYNLGNSIKSEAYLIYSNARSSILNAFYTPSSIADAMWIGLNKMGITQESTAQGIRVLDPSFGGGVFTATAPDFIKSNANFCGIELDTLTAMLSKQLYQKEDIRESGFESANLVDNFFDLSISNIPFGDYKVFDPKFNRHKLSIHNYFFAKALTKVKEGGIVAFITSSYTMDAKTNEHRELIDKSAEFVAAYRLPGDAFEKSGVSVMTDIIFLRKRPLDQKLETEAKWMNVALTQYPLERTDRATGNNFGKINVNEYFVANPDHILGNPVITSSQYSENVMSVKNDNWLADLNLAMQSLPSNVYQSVNTKPEESIQISAPLDTHSGNMIIINGEVYQNIANTLSRREDLDKNLSFVNAFVTLRDAVRTHLKTQAIYTEESSQFADSLQTINHHYDKFVEDFGFLNEKKNRRIIIEEIDSPLLFSLEKWDELSRVAKKADIFSRHTAKMNEVMRVDTVTDGVVYSLSEKGYVDIDFISEKLNMPASHIQNELLDAGVIFINPENGGIEESGKYLSGNVREKLKIAKIAAETDTSYLDNVTALEAVQPKYIPANDISLRLGASWLPIPVLTAFIRDISGVEDRITINVSYQANLSEWRVELNEGRLSNSYSTVKNTSNFGTKEFTAIVLAEMAMNQKQPKITYKQDDKVFVDVAKTAQIREIQSRLKAYFSEFVLKNPEFSKMVEENYNQQVNNIHLREYSGKHLTIPGMNSAFVLRDSQKDAIWRVMSSENNVLFDHCVGAGKTAAIIGSAMECRRIKKASKPMIVVPNNILEQMAANFVELYPAAKILVANDYFSGKAQRRLFQSQVATGDWDSVIISYSAFEKIAIRPKTIARYVREQIDHLDDVMASIEQSGSDSRMLKRIEKKKKNLQVKLEDLLDAKNKDDIVYFEDLGVDMLLVDEADNFKNLGFETKMERIPGLSDVRSKRAEDMFIKTGLVNKVVFATGTPISNTIGEMYTMMRYLYRHKLYEHGVSSFDEWAATFTDTVTAIEMAPDGGSYRMATRFAKFNNMPELMAIYKSFADIKTKEMLQLPIPEAETKITAAKSSDELANYISELVIRSDKVAGGQIDPREDNKLKITNDGRKAALDMRLVDPLAKDDPGSKLNLMVNNIFEQYTKANQTEGSTELLQLVFSDIGVNSMDAGGRYKFSLYDDIRVKLVAMGMNPSEIRFAQEAKDSNELEQIFAQARSGQVRVLIGSTIKMGAGTNVQKYLSDIHHLDCPWRPRDIEQRDGRGERQGNLNKRVRLHRYVTEKSFDVYQWQMIETKMKFVEQTRNNSSSCRSIEDVSSRALSFAEIKALATGNPLIIKKMGLEQEIGRLGSLESGFKQMMWERESRFSSMAQNLTSAKRKIDAYITDIATYEANKNSLFNVTFDKVDSNFYKFDGASFDNEEHAAEHLKKIVEEVSVSGELNSDFKIGNYKGFELYLNISNTFGRHVAIKGAAEYEIHYHPTTVFKRIHTCLELLPEELKKLNEKFEFNQKELLAMELACKEVSPYAEKAHAIQMELNTIDISLGLLENDTVDDGDETSDKNSISSEDMPTHKH